MAAFFLGACRNFPLQLMFGGQFTLIGRLFGTPAPKGEDNGQ
jgi:hypothetical protein